MGWVPVLVAVLFFAPLYLTGELGVYSFDEPRSHLVWDEAMGQQPTPLDEPGGPRMLALQFAAGGGVVLAVLAIGLAWRPWRPRGS